MELIFKKILATTHIFNALPVPSRALYYGFRLSEGAHSKDFEALDANGVAWPFRLSTRQSSPYPKPVLVQASWLPFVKAKGLQANDEIAFYMETDEATRKPLYKVRARRKMKLLGKDLSADL